MNTGIAVVQAIANRAYTRGGSEEYRAVMEHLTGMNGSGSSRLSRAEELVRTSGVHIINPDAYSVRGSKSKRYAVTISNGNCHCECVDFQRERKVCKHILAAAIFRQTLRGMIDALTLSHPYKGAIADRLFCRGHLMRVSERNELLGKLPKWIARVFVWE